MRRPSALLPLALMAAGLLGAEPRLILAVGDLWPPYLDGGRPGQGLSAELARAALESQGYGLDIAVVPWLRAEQGTRDGDYDLLLDVWLTEKRTRYLEYSEPYATNEIKFIKRRGDPFRYEGLESLRGKIVGTIRGYGYEEGFLASSLFTRDEGTDFLGNLRKLLQGHVDLTLEDETVARALIAEGDPSLLDRIEFVEKPLSRNALYVASGLADPRHAELIAAFNRGLAAIRANGVYRRIMGRYGLD